MNSELYFLSSNDNFIIKWPERIDLEGGWVIGLCNFLTVLIWQKLCLSYAVYVIAVT